jgi:hypothetical protein
MQRHQPVGCLRAGLPTRYFCTVVGTDLLGSTGNLEPNQPS